MTATLPPSLCRHPLASLAMGADLNGALSTTSCDGETTAVTRERRHGVFTPHALLIKRPVGVRLLSPYALLITRLVGVRRRRRRRRRGRVVARTIAPIWEQLNILKRIRQAGITALKSFAEALRPILAISRVRCRLGGRSGLRPESRLPGLLLAGHPSTGNAALVALALDAALAALALATTTVALLARHNSLGLGSRVT